MKNWKVPTAVLMGLLGLGVTTIPAHADTVPGSIRLNDGTTAYPHDDGSLRTAGGDLVGHWNGPNLSEDQDPEGGLPAAGLLKDLPIGQLSPLD